MKIKPKKCKGTGKALGYGCGNESVFRKYGLCLNNCYPNWLYTSKEGRELLLNVKIRASKEVKQENDRKARKKKKDARESIKTRNDWINDLQKIFNKWIRQRDKGNSCISCGKTGKKENAGHYRSVGGNPELRIEPLNCHLQCEWCNTYLHGNLINYRINLIKKIGLEKVEWLEGKHEYLKLSIPEMKELIIKYKLRIKEYGIKNKR